MNRPLQIVPGQIYRATKPVRDAKYRQFVKRFPCIGCGQTWGIDPMHTGPHGLGQKSCDLTVLPGCRNCHQEFDADPRGFALEHGLDVAKWVAWFNAAYRTRILKEAA